MSTFTEHDIAMMENWRELRESKGISLEQISQQTNISVRKLTSIEAHLFDELGDETFAVGYLRSYAKILDEDPQVFIRVYRDAFSTESLEKQERDARKIVGNPFEFLLKNFSLLQISLAVIVLWVLIMVVFGGSADEGPAPVVEAIPQHSQEQLSQSKYEDAIDPNTVKPVMTPSPELEKLERVILETHLPEVAGVESEVASFEETEGTEDVPAAADASTSLGDGEDLLVLSFIDECWLEVKDTSGGVLIAELQRKGDNLRVFGDAPFEVMLGNARAASMTFNGEVVAVEPRPGRKTLRFTVPR